MRIQHQSLLTLLLALALAARVQAEDAKGLEFFEGKIRPVLVKHCYECHSANSAKIGGGFLLDTRDGLRAGGDSGAVIEPGKPNESLLIAALRHEGPEMPKEKLPEEIINDFVTWVSMGAPDPRNEKAAYKRLTKEEARSFWSLIPVANPQPPAVKQADWPTDPIDFFILAEKEQRGLAQVGDAPPVPWLRRVYFDLIGLPPSPEEVEAFVAEYAADPRVAIEKTVDQLLKSPQYGERWGRHWLDHVRYGESNGQVNNTAFAFAWRYRDYVIDAFNADTPYDLFIREQIAGDLLPASTPRDKDRLLIATGFLALTPQPASAGNPNFRMDVVADQIDVIGRAVMGMSVMCARCHDHKFDPITTREYYALAGIIDSTSQMRNESDAIRLSDGSRAMGVRDNKPHDTYICIRGESKSRGEEVPRGFIDVASTGENPSIPRNQSGRLELAQWITRDDHPLTARVAVNRVWMHFFGHALVRTPDNFGFTGETPSHPALLDHLATRFMNDGWSHKKLIRSIVLSRTYRQASSHHAANYDLDPDNVYLWRVPVRRIEAEPIRDAILFASGQLDLKPPGSSTMKVVVMAQGKRRQQYPQVQPTVRAVYLGAPRVQALPELLAVFDGANTSAIVAQRDNTTVPLQALFLMNDPWVAEQAGHFADRLFAAIQRDDAGRVELAYRLAFSRSASSEESRGALEFIQKMGNDRKAWASFCHGLFIAAEFRTIE